MLEELEHSLEVRKKQYLADKCILEKINVAIDTFRIKNCNTVEWLKKDLSQVIETQIDEYQNEIIKKLDPKQIKKRFPRGSNDFITYMEFVNETYRGRMTEQINRKTQGAICKYLEQMEIVFEEAVGYLKSRESLIALEDKFYGSLSESKSTMIRQATGEVQAVCTYCNTLTNASEELFMKIWEAKNSYDNKVLAGEIIGGGAGVVVGGKGTVLYMTKVMAVEATAVGLWPVVGALVGAAVIAAIAKTIVSAKSEGDMIQKVNQCLCKFREEVQQTKSRMIGQIWAMVDEIFRNELEMADKSFVDFRKSVNVDSCKIPLLEETFETTQSLIKKLETMKDGF